MGDRGALPWYFGKDFYRDLPKICVVPLVSPLGDKTGEAWPASAPRRAPGDTCRELDWRKAQPGAAREFQFRSDRPEAECRTAQPDSERLRDVCAAMAGVAGHLAPCPRTRPIEGVHHQNHPARSPLERGIVGIPPPVAGAFRDMAIHAVQAQGRGKEPHRPHEFLTEIPLRTWTFLKTSSPSAFLAQPGRWPAQCPAGTRTSFPWRGGSFASIRDSCCLPVLAMR